LLATAEQAALQAAELIKRTLKFALRKKGRREPVNLNQLVTEIGDFMCGLLEPRIHVQMSQAEDLWPVLGDRAQLKEVILNLCLNARDAISGQGTLLLQTENLRREADSGNATDQRHSEDFVCLRVGDTGGGIPTNVQARMFEPFFTTKGEKGTGMGLALVSAIVTSHGGWIDCRSELGKGTCFEVYLPRDTSGCRNPLEAQSLASVSTASSLN
jgi:two-component system cell cycle sensor histidine kinase/response regulator CckA